MIPKEKKKFEPFKVRTIRASDPAWEAFKDMRRKSGKTWDKFLLELANRE